jgi:2,3-bisphosphoglycerate-independent phosphoglycerate mutase
LLGGRLTSDLAPSDGAVLVRRLDATLGYSGLPQSATGQATLLTGRNCAAEMGGHYGPWPGPTLKRVLDQGTLFSEVSREGGTARMANAYPPGYFDALESGRARVNVPVYAARAAGLALSDAKAYGRGEGIAADLTGSHFAGIDPRLPSYTPEAAGGLLAGLAASAHLTFFDFWLSDRVGHRGTFSEAVRLVEDLDRFLSGVAGSLADVTLVVTSDHGNLEDKGTRGHTRSPVPLLALGPGRSAFSECATLPDVAPAARRALALEAA